MGAVAALVAAGLRGRSRAGAWYAACKGPQRRRESLRRHSRGDLAMNSATMQAATLSPAERNAELLRSGYDAFARGDMAALAGLFSPAAVWHVQRLGQLGAQFLITL